MMPLDKKELAELKKLSKVLLNLNELYHKYLYLHSFDDIESEKNRIRNQFK